jgi:hypothetical protein
LVADADEFWYAPTGQTIVDAIGNLESFDLIYCNMSLFGAWTSDNHPASLRTDLVYRHPNLGPHEGSKWIAKTDALKTGRFMGVHRVGGVDSRRTITEHSTLTLNHYITQSRTFWFTVKMKRGDAVDSTNDTFRDATVSDQTNTLCTLKDTTRGSTHGKH